MSASSIGTGTWGQGGQLPPLWKPNMAPYRYTLALHSALQRDAWIYDSADWATRSDQEFNDKISRDPAWFASIERRRNSTAGRTWQTPPRSSEVPEDVLVASICKPALKEHFAYFRDARWHQTNSVFLGSAHQIVTWQKVRWAPPIPGCPSMLWWMPVRGYQVNRWRLRIVRDDDTPSDELSTHYELYSVARDRWERLTHPAAWVHSYFHLTEDTLGYGRGLNSYLFWAFRAKQIALTQGLEAVERWAQGMVTAKVSSEIAGLPADDTVAAQTAWLNQLEAFRSRNVLAYSGDDQIEIHWPSGSGHSMVMDYVRYWDEQGIRVIEGSSQASASANSGQSSGYASSKVHADESDDYLSSDRDRLAEDWERSVIRSWYKLNQNPLAAVCGLHGYKRIGACPGFSIGDEEVEDPQVVAGVVGSVLQSGVPLLKTEVYDKLGFTQPNEGDDVFEQPDPGGAEGGNPLAEMFGE